MGQKAEVSKEEIHFRGMFISLFIDIEFSIGESISTALVGENKTKLDLIEFVNPTLMLNSKIKLLLKILSRRYSKLNALYKKDLNQILSLSDLRNNFAHKPIDVDVKTKTLNFKVVTNGRINKEAHSFADLESKFQQLTSMFVILNKLESDIKAA